jgi:hypothetical protein
VAWNSATIVARIVWIAQMPLARGSSEPAARRCALWPLDGSNLHALRRLLAAKIGSRIS